MKLIVEDFLKQIAHQSSFAKISLHFHEVHLVKELFCSMKSLNNIGALKITFFSVLFFSNSPFLFSSNGQRFSCYNKTNCLLCVCHFYHNCAKID